jgi:hypothetical protein
MALAPLATPPECCEPRPDPRNPSHLWPPLGQCKNGDPAHPDWSGRDPPLICDACREISRSALAREFPSPPENGPPVARSGISRGSAVDCAAPSTTTNLCGMPQEIALHLGDRSLPAGPPTSRSSVDGSKKRRKARAKRSKDTIRGWKVPERGIGWRERMPSSPRGFPGIPSRLDGNKGRRAWRNGGNAADTLSPGPGRADAGGQITRAAHESSGRVPSPAAPRLGRAAARVLP